MFVTRWSEWSTLNGLCWCIFDFLRVSTFNGLHLAPGPFLLWQTTVCHDIECLKLSTIDSIALLMIITYFSPSFIILNIANYMGTFKPPLYIALSLFCHNKALISASVSDCLTACVGGCLCVCVCVGVCVWVGVCVCVGVGVYVCRCGGHCECLCIISREVVVNI